MIEIFDVKYSFLSETKPNEILALRKKIFKDRLDWAVKCTENMGLDEYDNENATYLFGISNGEVICSLRLIEMKYPNMITGTFGAYFNQDLLPTGNYVEASRFMLDKTKGKPLKRGPHPVAEILFLAVLSYAKKCGYQGIMAIVSNAILKKMKNSGWQLVIIEEVFSEQEEQISLVQLPVDDENQQILIECINSDQIYNPAGLILWPLLLREK